MKLTSRFQLLAGAALFAAGLVSGLMAAQSDSSANSSANASDVPFRTEQKRADLTGAPGMEVIASIVEIKPGETSNLHFHHGIEVAYVLQGSLVQATGQAAPTLNPTGATILNPRDMKHGSFKVVGERPLRLFAVHIVDKGKPLYAQ